jgi:CRISPR/Cas system CSM-associated protein Csm4 (group 5 of RAMP superfamily)
MQKLIVITVLICIIFSILFFIYKEGQGKGQDKEIKKQQQNEIQIQHEIIEEKKQIVKRKHVNKSKPTAIIKDKKIVLLNNDSNFSWLYENRCKDCQSR